MTMTFQLSQPGFEPRLAKQAWWLLMLLWAVQVWYPQMGYPNAGVREAAVLAILVVLAAVLRMRGRGTCPGNLAGAAGAALVAAYVVRYVATGMPAAGSDNLGTLLVCSATAMAGYFLIGVAVEGGAGSASLSNTVCSDSNGNGHADLNFRDCVGWFLVVVCAVALLCSVHAICQYFWIYDQHYERLLADIGTNEPTPLQTGLLHHLRLRRVASVWGDPNALGGFLGISMAASVTLAMRGGWWTPGQWWARLIRLVGVGGVPLSLVAIALTRSRGGMLDAVLSVCAVLILRRRHTVLVTVALAVAAGALLGTAADVGTTKPAGFWRSNTIRERLNYAQVGVRIVAMNPAFGSGPGAVDLYYGRYKTPYARESKYLHNWILQVTAETGVVGLLLSVIFVGLLGVRALRCAHRADPWFLAVMIMTGVFVADALLELSFNQREMMMFFGMCGGILLAGGSRKSRGGSIPGIRIVRTAIPAVVMAALLIFQLVPTLLGAACKDAAKDAFEVGDLSNAHVFLRHAQGWTPRDPQIYLLLSQLEARAGSPDSAFLMLEKAIRLNAHSASLRAQVAELALDTGQVHRAETAIRQALEIYPSKAEYHHTLARVLERSGDLSGAIESAQQAVDLSYLYRDKYEEYLRRLEAKAK